MSDRVARNAAEKIAAQVEAAFQPHHEYRQVSLEDFPWLDLRRYEELASSLEGEGFVRLGDVEDLTLGGEFEDLPVPRGPGEEEDQAPEGGPGLHLERLVRHHLRWPPGPVAAARDRLPAVPRRVVEGSPRRPPDTPPAPRPSSVITMPCCFPVPWTT